LQLDQVLHQQQQLLTVEARLMVERPRQLTSRTAKIQLYKVPPN